MINRREIQSRPDTSQVHIRVSGSVLKAFDNYGKQVAKQRNRSAVSRSIVFERLVTDAHKAGILS